ncbi:MAG TPA: dockerin type I domain-containing protein, partial [Candidatus Saccharimonadales bacterium]|nr:dockerin type I domain-containing protein [Candidatus Saccharimonadales bacterium]
TVTARAYDAAGNTMAGSPVTVTVTGTSTGSNPYSCPDRPTLQRGSTGDCVKRVQWYLNQKINAGLVIDGAYGSITEGKVKEYQTSVRLTASGIVDAATWNALEGTTTTPTPPAPTPPAPTPSPTAAGDVNGDGRVNAIDLSALITNDGKSYPAADFNNDGVVGAADMSILLARWTW